MIIHEIRKLALEASKREALTLESFGMGALYTYTRVSGKNGSTLGVALTPRGEGELSSLVGLQSIEEILEGAGCYDVAKRALALSCINAIGQYELSKNPPQTSKNLRERLSCKILDSTSEGSKIVVIGNLKPVVKKLRDEGRSVEVFCREKREIGSGVYNDIFEYESLMSADAVVITGASLIGSTIDAVLHFAKNAKVKIVAGFSASLHPSWLAHSGITHIASIYLERANEQELLKNDLEGLFAHPCYLLEV